MCSEDTKQAYIQCEQEGHHIALIQPEEVERSKDVQFRLLRIRYVFSESGDSCNRKPKSAITRILRMVQMTGDQSMYIHYRREPDGQEECGEIIGNYVDDLLCCGTDEFKFRSNRLRDVINLKDSKKPPFVFACILIKHTDDPQVTLDQQQNILNLI